MSDFNELNVGPRWYIAHTYTGYENKVKATIERVVANRNLCNNITNFMLTAFVFKDIFYNCDLLGYIILNYTHKEHKLLLNLLFYL